MTATFIAIVRVYAASSVLLASVIVFEKDHFSWRLELALARSLCPVDKF